MGRKGGIPNVRLKGLTDPDFFQKNTTLEKGWTFNYDGTIVDFKKPKNQRELDEKVAYEVSQETLVKDNPKGNNRYGKGRAAATGTSTNFRDTVKSAMTAGEATNKGKNAAAKDKDTFNEYSESYTLIQQEAHKQGVIELDRGAPSKVMTIAPGVELIEKNKSVKGDNFSLQG